MIALFKNHLWDSESCFKGGCAPYILSYKVSYYCFDLLSRMYLTLIILIAGTLDYIKYG